MPEDYFGEQVAAGYDLDVVMAAPEVVNPVVDFLADLTGEGTALEFAIGTGRIALPLSQRGVRVAGIDLSDAMVRRLRAKPGAESINVTIGDFATTRLGEVFTVVFLVYNGISNLTTQDEQVECFANAAAHLEPGGCFVIEVMVPPLQRLPPGERFRAFTVTPEHVGVDEIDVVTQQAVSHHFWVTDSQSGAWPVPWRYVWPSELDLMARLAGMTLRERWGGWGRQPFTAKSVSHISVWETPGA
jgi:SAM-dependent methyltransferase